MTIPFGSVAEVPSLARWRLLASGVLLLTIVGACRPTPPAPLPVPPMPAPVAPTPAPAASAPVAPATPAAAAETATGKPGETPADKPADPPNAKAAEKSAEKPADAPPASDAGPGKSSAAAGEPKTEVAEPATASVAQQPASVEPDQRFLVLTPGGPVQVGVVISLQGATLDAALEQLVEAAFRAADEDGDGQATWKDVLENPKFQSGQFGNLMANDAEQRAQLVRLYDADRDGLVDRSELPRFLTRNSGGGRAFALQSSNEFRSSNRPRSATRLILDADRNGAIDAQEATESPGRLLHRDADNDEAILAGELKQNDDADELAPRPAMSGRRRTDEPDTAVWLTNPGIDLQKRWGMVLFLLQELYSYGDPVRSTDWPLTPQLFTTLDTDQDGTLERSEVPQLAEQSPHLVIEVSFGGDQPSGPRLKLRSMNSELASMKPVVRERPSRLSLELSDVELEFFVNEDPALTNAAQAAMTQFMALDRDQNGYLSKEEVPNPIPGTDATFESFDADRDGKVVLDELRRYLDQRFAVARAQVRARVADQEDALFSALDTDGDGRLSQREVRQVPDRLRGMDRNQDGLVQTHEIPGSMVVGFVRGNSDQDPQLFAAPAVVGDPVADQPKWFRGMDANADGEISRREFFGTQDRFATLDKNQDGYLSVDEAAAAGK